ncbi:MAG TPA: anthranilate phosphoribosyltransferase [Vampirovibrionales bacterium]
MNDQIQKLINAFSEGQDLDEALVDTFLDELSSEATTKPLMAALTAAWKCKGESSQELALIATNVLKRIGSFSIGSDVLDCCGTGGDHSGTFNISTTAAFILATAGIKVAKHGGRKTTSASGSIDLLEELGVPTFSGEQQIKETLKTQNLVFISSPATHKLLGRWKSVCKKLSFSGQTGLVGTLTNPIHLSHQLLGVPKYEWGTLMVEAQRIMGRKNAIVVFGEPQLDEASFCGRNHLWILKEGSVHKEEFDVSDFRGLASPYTIADIQGSNPKQNALLFKAIISGQASSPIVDTVCLNAGLGFYLVGKTSSIQDGFLQAKEIVHSGSSEQFFNEYINYNK